MGILSEVNLLLENSDFARLLQRPYIPKNIKLDKENKRLKTVLGIGALGLTAGAAYKYLENDGVKNGR